MVKNINEFVDVIEVSHRVADRDDAKRLAKLLRMKGVKLNLVTVNTKALAAYNNIIEEKISQGQNVGIIEQYRISSMVERLYGSSITKSTYLDRPESIERELDKDGVEWVIYGKINVKKLKSEKGFTFKKLINILSEEGINVNLHENHRKVNRRLRYA